MTATSKARRVPAKLRKVADRHKAKPTTEELRQTIRAAVEQGHRPADLARLFDVNRQQINKWLHQG